jgi:hypothetical protein
MREAEAFQPIILVQVDTDVVFLHVSSPPSLSPRQTRLSRFVAHRLSRQLVRTIYGSALISLEDANADMLHDVSAGNEMLQDSNSRVAG